MGAALHDLLLGIALGVGLILGFTLLRFIFGPGNPFVMPPPQKVNVGQITEETLKTYAGYDITKPLLVAVRGRLYDVGKDRDVYGPSGSPQRPGQDAGGVHVRPAPRLLGGRHW
jgi:hypothetical protein